MKTKWIRIITIILVLVLAVSPISVMAAAPSAGSGVEPQASNYIHTTYADTINNGGTVTVSFNVGGTGLMNSIGAEKIVIKTSSGSIVRTYNYFNNAGMMGYNKYAHGGTVTWTGGSATTKYYAVVTFKAANASGSDTVTYITQAN